MRAFAPVAKWYKPISQARPPRSHTMTRRGEGPARAFGGSSMKRRTLAAVGLFAAVATLAAVVAGSTSGATKKTTATITVWLQVDAKADNWAPIVSAANAAFQQAHPGVNVDVQYQTWGTHLQKFDATLAGGNSPDVIEMGNTEMTKYMAAGAFQSLSGISFPNQSTWLEGLAASGRYGGQTYGVPYYAG